ncbi:MAG: PhzF family phenazine biosynthesis protein [Candidatus Heimdallarchaeota archaeon]|nr:PhzF family phenazine biosynthesis protein [Candidatus Heimdallarchaeota archaeon]MCK5409406.1 PhzF family phenazine biosynthesis protein [Candidatus Heimdallarchaeota archaeon]
MPIYQIDAFTDEPFRGNPAAICLISENYPDITLQKIAAEMNLSETAFLYVPNVDEIKKLNRFRLRWFTPQVEVNLCGHATLATSHLLFHILKIDSNSVTYETLSGELIASKTEDGVILDFPMNDPEITEPLPTLLNALGVKTAEAFAYSKGVTDMLIELDSVETISDLKPDYERLKRLSLGLEIRGVIVTARGGENYDFISRFFAPWVGINEDPVTGSAHTILAPYWAKILGKKEMKGYQMSKRGGEITVKISENNRVELIGKSILILKGEFFV